MKTISPVVAALLTMMALPARAAAPDAKPCSLVMVTSVDMDMTSDGRVTIPVGYNGHTFSFLVDTGGYTNTISRERADELDLPVTPGDFRLVGVAGSSMSHVVHATTFSIGRLVGHDFKTYVDLDQNEFDGVLAPDILAAYDVEFDFAHGKFNLFSQDHCPGRVVYWTKQPYAEIPLQMGTDRHMTIPVTVEGKPLVALVDTGASASLMRMSAARDVLGQDENASGMTLVTKFGPNDSYRRYSYPFKSLSLEGASVKNPNIEIWSNAFVRGFDYDMILGIGVLRQMRIFISYKEKKMYVTPALAN